MIPLEQIKDFYQAFVDGLDAVLGDKLFGVYLYGAVAFPESGPTRDIDFHVILRETLTDGESAGLYDLHASLAREYPGLGGEMDGYYILLQDARQKMPPKSQMWSCATDDAWALHRQHIRAGRCIILRGPEPKQVYPPTSWPELEEVLFGELRYVEHHLCDFPDFCILNLCRLMYSFETQDVVTSKMSAAVWAWDAFPEWRRHIEAARKSYAAKATPEDREFMMSEVGGIYRFACAHIQESRRKRSAEQGAPADEDKPRR